MINKKFYVYFHRRKDNNKVFYVGKGCGKRAWVKCNKKNSKWKDIANSVGYYIEIFKDNLTESEAESLELELINKYHQEWSLTNILKKPTSIKKIDVNLISEMFEYDETSPSCLRWKKYSGTKYKAGDVAGSKKFDENGNPHKWTVCLKYKLYSVHRIIFLLHNNSADQSLIVNHIDCDPHNNKIDNLELISKAENNKRTKQQVYNQPRSNNTSGIIGVRFCKIGNTNYVTAYCSKNGKAIYKSFSINKLGEEEALKQAIAWRKSNT